MLFVFYKYIYVLYRWILKSSFVSGWVSYLMVYSVFWDALKRTTRLRAHYYFVHDDASLLRSVSDYGPWSNIMINNNNNRSILWHNARTKHTHHRHLDRNWNPKAKEIAPHPMCNCFLWFHSIQFLPFAISEPSNQFSMHIIAGHNMYNKIIHPMIITRRKWRKMN